MTKKKERELLFAMLRLQIQQQPTTTMTTTTSSLSTHHHHHHQSCTVPVIGRR